MIKWFTALLFSIAIHILIFLSYVFFATESEVSTSRKITNVNFFDEELQEKIEVMKRKALHLKKENKKKQLLNNQKMISQKKLKILKII